MQPDQIKVGRKYRRAGRILEVLRIEKNRSKTKDAVFKQIAPEPGFGRLKLKEFAVWAKEEVRS